MNEQTSINLLRPQAKLPTKFSTISESLQKISVTSLIVFLVVGIVVAAMYFIMQMRFSTLVTRRDQMRTKISTFAQSEALLVALQERVRVVDKLLSSQVDWAATVERMNQLAPPGVLASVAVDGKQRVVMTITTDSIEALFPVLSAIISDVDAKRILSPTMVSFQLYQDGVANVIVSFFPVI